LPLLPEEAIEGAVSDLETFAMTAPPVHVEAIKKLLRYIRHKWWLQSVGAQRLSVVGIPDRPNGVENFHKQLKLKDAREGFTPKSVCLLRSPTHCVRSTRVDFSRCCVTV